MHEPSHEAYQWILHKKVPGENEFPKWVRYPAATIGWTILALFGLLMVITAPFVFWAL